MKQQYQFHLCSLTLNNQCFLRFCFSEFKEPLALSKTVKAGIELQLQHLDFFFFFTNFTVFACVKRMDPLLQEPEASQEGMLAFVQTEGAFFLSIYFKLCMSFYI